MSNIKKLMMSAAGGDSLDVDDVFSTYLYTGNGVNPRTITNNFDVATEGGLIWLKTRASGNHTLYDTERGVSRVILSNESQAEVYASGYGITSFNTDGFTTGLNMSDENINNKELVAWSFRQAPKFFDVVTYTGAGALQSISHNLGSVPGCIIIKCTSTGSTNWMVYHRGEGANRFGYLNEQNSFFTNTGVWQNTTPTASQFYLGFGDAINGSGKTYVAYLFAHNDGDGGFGPDGDQDIIKCGSYTTTGTGVGSVDLGFEPQWILVRASEITNNWFMADSMRGWSVPISSTSTTMQYLFAHSSTAENDTYLVDPTATGFDYRGSGSNRKYIYMAIRRGSLFPPEAATDVFAAAQQNAVGTEPGWTSGFPVDMVIDSNVGGGSTDTRTISSRLTQGRYLATDQNHQEFAWATGYAMDYMDGWRESANNGPSDMGWMWKRAPGFFDVVPYNGNSTDGRTVSHNLGVTPEMIWVKRRDNYHGSQSWVVYHKNLDATNPAHKYLRLNDSEGVLDSDGKWYDTAPTDSVFTVANNTDINNSNGKYIAYLFATLGGISKVGSYTGNGSNQTINCGFTSGARFILIKRTIANSDWYVWDTARGIITGSETALIFNSTSATYNDSIDPANSGFIVNQISATNINVSNATYIFYAVA